MRAIWTQQSLFAFVATLLLALQSATAAESDYFGIHVVDAETGRGVPLVELKTVSGLLYITDSAGWVAFNEPDLMNQKVYFHVSSHGYEYPADGFGLRGKAFDVKAGSKVELPLARKNLAERLYRVTGSGIYRDSILLGEPVPLAQPLANAQVQGSDSVQLAEYGGQLHWFWGDTSLARYPLGIFHMPGAVSRPPSKAKLDIEQGIDLTYFQDDKGAARNTAQMSGDGPTWISGVTVVPDQNGQEQMIAGYTKIRGALEVYRRGLCRWNNERGAFDDLGTVAEDAALFPIGHPFAHLVDGKKWIYYCEPLPTLRVPATAESVLDVTQYEAFTCLQAGSRLTKGKPRAEDIERDAQGIVRWAWKKDAPQLDPSDEARWLDTGVLKADEARLQLKDVESGKRVTPHRGNVAWNEYRNCWTLVFGQINGTSLLGEIWYAEADDLPGPWPPARKIVTHEKYDFYNPCQHPVFQKENGKVIYFEGTYTHTFAGNPRPTPRYDYNQIMYRLDLSQPRLKLESR
ncbi:hypothetical protein ETAA8_11420 [Anatilimnocola aggregata]|uniref:Uncharacterized protein n=1 Tax=Anatilimnocola aggregata TaxID=2528021 RepID=A0A517Y759_9BACT|nr:hypothetical protein [Anatilimnocola aggregata]QDU26069.1 hypothetical protein ETAA8_11420 [Anatilimnocola aggregata]